MKTFKQLRETQNPLDLGRLSQATDLSRKKRKKQPVNWYTDGSNNKQHESVEIEEGRFEYDKKTGQMGYNKNDPDQRHGLYINGKLIATHNSREQAENVKKRDKKFKDAEIKKIS